MIESTQDASVIKMRAMRISIVVFVTTLLIGTASLVVRLQAGQSVERSLFPLMAMVASLVSMWLIRNGRAVAGSYLIMGALWIIAYGVTVQTSGIGIWLAIVAFLITSVIVTQVILDHKTRGIIANAVLAFALVFLDLYWPYARSPLPPPLDVIAPVFLFLSTLFPIYFAVREFPSYSLLVKLFITNVLVVVGAVMGLVFFIGNSTGQTITNSVGNTLRGVADVQALNIGNLLAQQVGLMQAFSFNNAFQSILQSQNDEYLGKSAEEIEATINEVDHAWHEAEFTDSLIQDVLNNALAVELSQFRRSFPAYSEMVIVDEQGVLVSSTNRTEHYDNSDEKWWESVSNGFTYISDPSVDATSRVINVDIAIPIIARNTRNVIGALHATYSLRDLRSALLTAESGLGETGQLGLLLPGNQLLDAASFSTIDLSPETAVLLEDTADEPYAVVDFADISRFVSQVDLRTTANLPIITELGWVVVAQQELQSSLEPVEDQQRGLIVLGITALAISSIVVAIFGRVLIRPIVGLIKATQAVADGDLDARAEVVTRDEIGQLAVTFNGMADEIQHTMSGLEGRVAERTLALATTIEVSRDISTILDQQALITEVVEVTQRTFGYYHVHVYLVDQGSNELHMVGGTGEAGAAMMSRGHKMPMGVGLVGRAAVNNETILVSDTLQDDEWQPNSLLPDTRSELAIPIAFGAEEVFGVLDVQQNMVDGLTEDDMHLLQSVANQTAVALRNIRLYQEIQTRAERETTANLISQKIQSAMDVDAVLRIVARELGDALGAQQTNVQINRQE